MCVAFSGAHALQMVPARLPASDAANLKYRRNKQKREILEPKLSGHVLSGLAGCWRSSLVLSCLIDPATHSAAERGLMRRLTLSSPSAQQRVCMQEPPIIPSLS